MPRADWKERLLYFGYRHRFIAAIVTLALVIGAFAAGGGQIARFSSQLDSMKEPGARLEMPRMFDMRTDIWFDPQDTGMSAYHDVEDQFIAEDVVLVSFEDTEDPWGVFGERSIATIARLTAELERVPYVRAVRSLTKSPWIRWGEVEPGEPGLLVGDMFDGDPKSFSKRDRLQRMIAVLGAERAIAIAGEEAVRDVIGDADPKAYVGEPRFIDSIVSSDGKTAALALQVLRQRPTDEALDAAFGEADDATGKDIGPALHVIEAQTRAVKRIQEIVAKEPHYDVHIAGIPVLEQHFPEVGMRDMGFMGLMFAAMAGVLAFVFRRLGGVIIPLLVVTSSIMGMLGVVFFAGDLINNLTATAPVVMTAVGIADAVHLVTAYYLLRPDHTDKRELILEVIRRNAVPVLLTSLTTAAAFFSLMTSDIVPVKMFGYTAGLGTLIAYAVTMLVVPALLSVIPLKQGERRVDEPKQARHWTDPLLDAVLRHKGAVLAGSIVALGASVFGMANVQVESDLRLMFPNDDPVTSDLRWIEKRLGGVGDLDIVFYGPESAGNTVETQKRQARIQELLLERHGGTLSADGGKELARLEGEEAAAQRQRIASHAEFLTQVDAFERRLDAEAKDPGSPLSVLTSFDSGLSVLRKIHQVQNENDPVYYRVPAASDVPEAARKAVVLEDDITGEALLIPAQTPSSLAAQYYLQYENGAKPSQNLAPLVTQDRRGFRIAARMKSRATAEVLRTYDRIREIARAEFPALAGTDTEVAEGKALSSMRMTGKQYLFMNMLERFSNTLIVSMLLAVALITTLIMGVFRSVRLGLVSIVPNALPLVMPLGMMGVLGIPLDGPAVIVATVALGVCVDATIHFFSKFEAARKVGYDTETSLRKAFHGVGSAVTWTTIVLVVGFAAMSLSDFRPNMMIGVLGATMVLLAWVTDLVVTPALLALLGKRRAEAPDEAAAVAAEAAT